MKKGERGFSEIVDFSKVTGARGNAKPSPAIRLIPFDQVKLGTQRRYLVKGLIPRVGLTVAWGPPKCGKSFWCFDMLMHVALGWDYRGRRTQQGAVVYCAFEGQTGIEARVEAFRQHVLQDGDGIGVPFFIEPVTLDLVHDQRALITAIKQQLDGAEPVAIALDTLNRSIKGSESSDEDMTAYINAADAIREAFECAIIIVHHCGVEGTRPRGHTSLTGAADAQLAVRRKENGDVVVTVEAMKDGREGDAIAFKLEHVVVGTDEDGEDISSCIVVALDDSNAKPEKRAPKLKTATQRNAMRVLRELADDIGVPPPPTWQLPSSVQKIVPVKEWRKMLLSGGVLEDGPDERKRYSDLLQQLRDKPVIQQRDGMVWITSCDLK
jgi:hypothetical protein